MEEPKEAVFEPFEIEITPPIAGIELVTVTREAETYWVFDASGMSGLTADKKDPAGAGADIKATLTAWSLPTSPPVPASVKAWRLRAVAKLTGLWDDIEAVIAALPTEQQTVAREAFIDSEIERLHPLTLLIFAQLGKTETEADDIFRAAASLAASPTTQPTNVLT